MGNDAFLTGHFHSQYGVWVRESSAARATGIDAAAGNLYIYSSGTLAMTAALGGNVGIGTATPGAGLDIIGDTNPDLRIKATGVSSNAILRFVSRLSGVDKAASITTDWNGNFVLSPTGGQLALATVNGGGATMSVGGSLAVGASYNIAYPPANGMVVQGNVGIGTTNPGQVFQVVNPNDSAATANFGRDGDWNLGINRGGLQWSAGGREFAFDSNFPYRFKVGGTSIMWLASGSVGIGTTAPGANFVVQADSSAYPGKISIERINGSAPFTAATVGTGLGFTDYGGGTKIGGIYVSNSGLLTIQNNFGTSISLSNPYVHISQANISSAGGPAAPALSLDSTSGSEAGLYRPASSSIGFVTSRIERMRIDSAGDVGIGTTNPQDKFQVVGAAADKLLSFSAGLVVEAANSSTPVLVVNSKGAADIQRWQYNGTPMARITATGDIVGGSLQVQSAVGTLAAIHSGIKTVGMNSDWSVKWSNGTSNFFAGTTDVGLSRVSAGVLEVNNGTAGNPHDLNLRALNPAGGNVGIGTTNPSQKLSISDGALIIGDPHPIANTVVSSTGIQTSWGWGQALALRIQGESGTGFRFYQDYATNSAVVESQRALSLWSGNAERVRLTTLGDVGMGTTNPGAKLEVISNTNAIGLNVKSSTGHNAFTHSFENSGQSRVTLYSTNGGSAARALLYSYGTSFINPETFSTNGGLSIGTGNTSSYGLYVAHPSFGTGTAYFAGGTHFGGDVGIGTTSPTTMLDVVQPATTTTDFPALRINSTWNNNSAGTMSAFEISVSNLASSSTNSMLMHLKANGSTMFAVDRTGNVSVPAISRVSYGTVGFVGGVSGNNIQVNTYFDTIFSARGDELMRLKYGGNVGIGITAPGYALDVGSGSLRAGNSVLYYSGGNDYLDSLNTGLYIRASQGGAAGFLDLTGMNRVTLTSNIVTMGNNITLNLTSSTGALNTFNLKAADVVSGHLPKRMMLQAQDTPSGYNYGIRGGDLYLSGGADRWGNGAGNVILAHDGTVTLGNVGIGTTTPNSKMVVAGGGLIVKNNDVYWGVNGTPSAGSAVVQGNLYLGSSPNASEPSGAALTGAPDGTYGAIFSNPNIAGSFVFKPANSNMNAGFAALNGAGARALSVAQHNGYGISGRVGVGDISSNATGYAGALTVQNSYGASVPTLVIRNQASQTADSLQIRSSSDVSLVVISGAGNVGIGTTSPTRRLHTMGSVMFEGNSVEFGVTSAPVSALSNNSSGYIQVGGGNQNGVELYHHTTRVARFRNTNSFIEIGNVGIGTTNPLGALDVQGGIGAASTNGTHVTIAAQNAGAGGNNNGGNIVLLPGAATGTGTGGTVVVGSSAIPNLSSAPLSVGGVPGPSVYNIAAFDPTPYAVGVGGGITFEGKYSAGGSYTTFAGIRGLKSNGTNFDQKGDLALYTFSAASLSERMRIDYSGNVGIGTTNPVAPFHVKVPSTGNNQVTVESDNGFAGINLDGSASADGPVSALRFANNDDSLAQLQVNRAGANDAGDMLFMTQPTGGTILERMRIGSNGNVGIGTMAPGANLEINITGNGTTVNSLFLANNADVDNSYSRLAFRSSNNINVAEIIGGRSGSCGNGACPHGSLSFFTATSGTLTQKMVVNSSGNVGIGTTIPKWSHYFANLKCVSVSFKFL